MTPTQDSPQRLTYKVSELAHLMGTSKDTILRKINAGEFGPPDQIPRMSDRPTSGYLVPAWRVHAHLGLGAPTQAEASS